MQDVLQVANYLDIAKREIMFLDNLINRKENLSVIGLGYVGLPIAVAFARKFNVIGFDINAEKIALYKEGTDPTKEVGDDCVANTTINFTNDPADLQKSQFHVVAVPTPILENKVPDLSLVESACRLIGKNLVRRSIIVFESTVYPGVTEEICVPILEKESGLNCGTDFKVAYSPERINPGDPEHRLENIIKIVSGMDNETLEIVAKIYESIIEAGVYRASSIQVAEAAKVIENSQRDINIAFMNELSIIFNRMGIDTLDVLKAAGTKWNFLNFRPGLVGGHCIGVDPYYLTYCAEQYGYCPQVILSGRRINDSMGKHVAESVLKMLVKMGIPIHTAKVAVFGLTFKENCPDVRNSKVVSIVNELKDFGIHSIIYDPVADKLEAKEEYGIEFCEFSDLYKLDAAIIAVAHDEFKKYDYENMLNFGAVLADIKGILAPVADRAYWRL